MKSNLKKFSSIFLILCLLVTLLPYAAYAEAEETYNGVIEGTVGQYLSWDWPTRDEENIGNSYPESGYLPTGLELDVPGSNVQSISGTPSEAGDFMYTMCVQTMDHIYHVNIDIHINEASSSCSTSLSGKVGTAISNWNWGTINGENIGNLYISSGSVPSGLSIPTPGSNAFSIEGTPTVAGDGSFTVFVGTMDADYYVQVNYSISAADEKFEITKSPTSENTKEGGNATFIATATNYSYVDWLLLSGGTTVGTYRGESNTMYGTCNVITYKDSGKEYLVLKNIPSSMNGFTIQARFTNTSKNSSIQTTACTLTVQATALKTPTISTQPVSATSTVGETVTLTTVASDPNGGTLKYQWYSAKSLTSSDATIINGATQSTYTPPQTVGTIYYYCSITSTKDGKTSSAITTTPVAVVYNSVTSSPSPSPSASPNPSNSPEVSPTASPSVSKNKGNSTGLLILLIVLILISAAALIFLILFMRKKNTESDAVPERVTVMKKWECPECGTKNRAGSRFCSECGAANPNTNRKN